MRTALFSALAVALLSPVSLQADEKAELAKLKGLYKAVSLKSGGKDAPPAVQKAKLEVKGDQFIIISEFMGTERKSAMTAKLDDSKSPRQVDLGRNGKTRYQGIYKLDGKKLTICYDRSGKTRPTKFESPADSQIMLLVFEKTK